MTRATRDPI